MPQSLLKHFEVLKKCEKQIWLIGVRNAFDKSFNTKFQHATRLHSCESIFMIFTPFYVLKFLAEKNALNAVICIVSCNFSLIMESWLRRNVRCYRSILLFHVLRNLFKWDVSADDNPGKLKETF